MKWINIFLSLRVETKRHQKPPKTLNFVLGNSFTIVTFKIFFPKKSFMLANWIVDGTQYAFHKNWLYRQSRTEWVGREENKKSNATHQ